GVLITALVCMLVAAGGAAAARLGASGSVLRHSVAEGRRGTDRPHRPLWQRLYVDLICLGLSGLIYWLTVRTGFSAVVNPDSNPTLSLSVYMFFAPALLWLGATLFLVRLRGRAFARVAHVPGVSGTSAVDHSYAYVGPDLQDTYGIDPGTISKATTLRDSYFLGGGSAAENMARLRAHADGVLVSQETISDYSLHPG